MKAIPIKYNGILYRSKLEAKWAAYFDLCGAKYEYEPQAFDLGNGVKYLPDFCVKNVLSVHGMCGAQTLGNSKKYDEFWFECKGVMSDYDAEKIKRFRMAIEKEKVINEHGFCEYKLTDCPFYVLDRSPAKMFMNDSYCDEEFNFYSIDCDDFPFVIAKPNGIGGLGLFGGDSNYTCLMDDRSQDFAFQVESMFRWDPSRT